MLEWFADICTGLSNVMNLAVFIAAFLGVLIGIIIGLLPGLGPPVAISLAIPITLGLDPVVAISLMLGIYKGGTYGGSISAILINTPGTSAAACTVLDGYPMTLQGKGGKALDIALYSSCFGDAFSIMLLCIVCQPIAMLASLFGPPEIFSLLLFAMTVIAGLSGSSLTKGLISAFLGLALATVGMDAVEGTPRLTFGSFYFEAGFNVVAIIVGVFAISEQLWQYARYSTSQQNSADISEKLKTKNKSDGFATLKEIKNCFVIWIQSSVIGVLIGALPGTGSTMASFMAYGAAQKRSKKPEEFGKGSYEGVAAAESGNNAVCGGALVPMLTLGIPGDVITAILLSALMIHGIQCGPSVFTEHREFVFTLFGMLLVSIFMMLFLGKVVSKVASRLASLPQPYIAAVVVMLCIMGIYSLSFSMFDVWTMMVMGAAGFFLVKLGVPLAPLVISFILEPKLEASLRQSMLISNDSPLIFLTHPVSLFFVACSVFAAVRIVLRNKRQHAQSMSSQEAECTPDDGNNSLDFE